MYLLYNIVFVFHDKTLTTELAIFSAKNFPKIPRNVMIIWYCISLSYLKDLCGSRKYKIVGKVKKAKIIVHIVSLLKPRCEVVQVRYFNYVLGTHFRFVLNCFIVGRYQVHASRDNYRSQN